jgi:ketosteroid isomerase-like protein
VSSAEENKAIVRYFLKELDKGNLDVIDELLSPDFVDRSLVPGQGPTREDFKRTQQEVLDALGDYLLEELYSFVGEGWEQEDDITLLTLERSAT